MLSGTPPEGSPGAPLTRKLVPFFLLVALAAVPVGFGALGAELSDYGRVVFAGAVLAAVCGLAAGRRTV